jgi:O-methyltransferase involved in polyketide biosynthesis
MLTAVKGFDPSQPNIARVYDYLLGGKDNFAADREVGDKLIAMDSGTRALVRSNRFFVAQATTRAAEAGILQFLDLGAGLPTSPAVHEIASQARDGVRVVYVDNDPVVFAHSSALLPKTKDVIAVSADLTKADEVLTHPQVRATLDLSRPVCVMFAATMHFFDSAEAGRILSGYMDLVASGSWLMLSVAHNDDQATWTRGKAAYTAAELYNHDAKDLSDWLGDWALLPPGIAEARRWASGIGGTPVDHPNSYSLCAVGIKP